MEKTIGVSEFLVNHIKHSPASFHMPGHKGKRIFLESGMEERLAALIDGDITEIEGADNLFQAEGIIRETMDKYREIYGAKESFLLINGSSTGLISAILATVPPGGKLAVARNCHKSVINGVRLGKITPVYIYPEMLEDFGISGGVTAEAVRETLEREGDINAVLITSPSYYGICSDIKAIAEVVHSFGAVLIVDQAHGAHLKMLDEVKREVDEGLPGMPLSADGQGADVVIESTHKTLCSFTQTAIANIYGDRVSLDSFADKLQMTESSSPSYILMSSLDMNADIMIERGEELGKKWKENLDRFYDEVKTVPGLRVLEHGSHDRTKLVFDSTSWGLTGDEVDSRLQEMGVFMELTSGNLSVAMTGIGNIWEDYKRLLDGLKKIADERQELDLDSEGESNFTMTKYMYKVREQREIPSRWEKIHYTEGEGRVSAVSIIPYPPGVPMITPGEVLDMESLEYAMEMRSSGAKVIGIDKNGFILVGSRDK